MIDVGVFTRMLSRIIANGFFWEGNECLKQKNYKKALKKYDQAVNTYPKYYEAWYKMGLAHRGLGKYKKAIDCFKKAIKIKPDYSSAWYKMGLAHRELGKYKKAIDCFQRVVNTRLEDDKANHNMGWAYRKLKEPTKIEYADAWFQLGWSYESLGDHKKAIDCYEKVLGINPDHGGAKKNLEASRPHVTSSFISEPELKETLANQSLIEILNEITKKLNIIDSKLEDHDTIVKEKLGEIAKTIPLPSRIEVISGKVRNTLRLIFTCSCNAERIGEIHDKEWRKWVKLLAYGMKLGAKIVIGDYSYATADLQHTLDLYKKKETIPDQTLLTQREKDKLLEKLRVSKICKRCSIVLNA